jgi:hypothetical protein
MAVVRAATQLAGDITHGASGTPSNCARVESTWVAAIAGGAPDPYAAQISAPSGGLFGGGAIVDANDGTYINYNASALDGFSDVTLHTGPDNVFPSVTDARNQSIVFQRGRVITSNWVNDRINAADFVFGGKVDAVSAVYMSESILNEWTTETGLAAASEWVITFPTKRYYVNGITNAAGNAAALPPFTTPWSTTRSEACEPLGFTLWNREEATEIGTCATRPGGCFSPPPAAQPPSSLCYESNIVSFGQTSAIGGTGGSSESVILGSRLTRNLNTPAVLTGGTSAGWMRLTMSTNGGSTVTRRQRKSLEGHTFVGLPAVGFWAVSIQNVQARPNKFVYGGAFDHKRTRACESGTPAVGTTATSCTF